MHTIALPHSGQPTGDRTLSLALACAAAPLSLLRHFVCVCALCTQRLKSMLGLGLGLGLGQALKLGIHSHAYAHSTCAGEEDIRCNLQVTVARQSFMHADCRPLLLCLEHDGACLMGAGVIAPDARVEPVCMCMCIVGACARSTCRGMHMVNFSKDL
jgi:hypothetical protein